MPIYEYACRSCSERFELLTYVSKADRATCPKCGSVDVKRLMSTFASVSVGDSQLACDSCELGYEGSPGCGCPGACRGH